MFSGATTSWDCIQVLLALIPVGLGIAQEISDGRLRARARREREDRP